MTQADLLAWRPPGPTTPAETPARYTRVPKPRDYVATWAAWVAANPTVAADILAMAVAHLPSTPCSMDALFLAVRQQMRIPMNHSLRAAASDWAIAQEPRLANLIERRKRRSTK